MAKTNDHSPGTLKGALQRLQHFRWWAKVLLLTGFFFGLEQIDLFGISSATEDYSRTLVYRILATSHPQQHRDKLSVVMLDDRDLVEFDQHWPAQYEFHAAVLRALLDMGAAGVLVDIAFIDQRDDPGITELQAVAALYREKGIPLLVAGTPGEPPYPAGIRSELVGEVTVVQAPGGRDVHQGIVYPMQQHGHSTAAPAFYRALANPAQTPLSTLVDPTLQVGQPLSAMEVTWKISDRRELLDGDPAQPLDSYTHENCQIGTTNPIGRALRLLLYELPGNDSDLLNPCPYHTTLSTRALLSGDTRFESVIRDRAIVYGADLMMSADRVEPPTHPPLAAAHFHAMALDNLLHSGADYPVFSDSDWAAGSTVGFTRSDALMVACLMLLMMVAQIWESMITRRCPSSDNDDTRSGDALMAPRELAWFAVLLVGWTLSAALVVGAMSLFAYSVLGLGVSNWTGMLFFTLIRANGRVIDFSWHFVATLYELSQRVWRLAVDKTKEVFRDDKDSSQQAD